MLDSKTMLPLLDKVCQFVLKLSCGHLTDLNNRGYYGEPSELKPPRITRRSASVYSKVRITWNGQGGELDSIIVKNNSDSALHCALVKLVERQILSPGDSFTVEEIQP